jgi:uncharacterized repeat protein (TIGR03803 family)
MLRQLAIFAPFGTHVSRSGILASADVILGPAERFNAILTRLRIGDKVSPHGGGHSRQEKETAMRKRTNSGSFTTSRRPKTATALSVIVLALLMLPAQAAHAQEFSVLHTFTGGLDGADPTTGVTLTATGTLYGTTSAGGTYGYGTVFKLGYRGSGWNFSPIYEFGALPDGQTPFGGITVENGQLYGTTSAGGTHGDGTVYKLQPPPTPCKTVICYYDETILHSFQGLDGRVPAYVTPLFDPSGNIYGTTAYGGADDLGTAWELTPSNGGGYTENVINIFTGYNGLEPSTSLIIDSSGNLYSTAPDVLEGNGLVFELSPLNGGWTENILFFFDSSQNGELHYANNVVMDPSGNLYGALTYGGPGGQGTVYELTPAGGGWNFSLLWAFPNGTGGCSNPFAGVTLQGGNLYGVCQFGAEAQGEVFELSYSDGMLTLTDLHDFNGTDGAFPQGNVVFDANGNMYGTTSKGGDRSACGGNGCGTVWEITGLNDR